MSETLLHAFAVRAADAAAAPETARTAEAKALYERAYGLLLSYTSIVNSGVEHQHVLVNRLREVVAALEAVGSAQGVMSFDALDRELKLHIFSFVDDWHDVAAFFLAVPTLGLDILRSDKEKYAEEPLLSIAIALHCNEPSEVLTERLMRQYAWDRRATRDGAHWLYDTAEAKRASYTITCSEDRRWQGDYYYIFEYYVERVRGWEPDPYCGWVHNDRALARAINELTGTNTFYDGPPFSEGEEGDDGSDGVARKVRVEYADGRKAYYNGEHGNERAERVEYPDGRTVYFAEGEYVE